MTRSNTNNLGKGLTIRSRMTFGFSLVALVFALLQQTAAGGTWTRLTNNAPGPIQLMLLLPDGTIMAANPNTSSAWYRLTPDIHGSYVNGTWTTLASMHDTRLYYSTQILQDGRVFVAGGEYGTGAGTAEIYDPQANTWTYINPPTSLLDPTQNSPLFVGTQGFVDSGSMLLSNGKVLVAPVREKYAGEMLLYDPFANSWSAAGNEINVTQDEATFVKLPDDSVLTIDPGQSTSERYLPAFDQWIADTTVPTSIYDSIGTEMGAGFLMPDGRAFVFGATGNTAFYTAGQPNLPGNWAVGPTIPTVIQYPLDNNGVQGTAFSTAGAPPDAPAAMMRSGRILCVFSGKLYNDARAGTSPPGSTNNFWLNSKNPQYPSPTSFFEYNPNTNAFTQIPSPTAPGTANSTDNIPTYKGAMLDVPDGGVLYAHQGTDVYYYLPTEGPLSTGKPSISGFTNNGNGSYHLTGTLFSGISQGASYGDDLQMDTNYPIVRLTASNGNVYYARTFFWSSTSVAAYNRPVSTEFWLGGAPSNGGGGTYTLTVTANGISSDPITFPGPVWVDFTFAGAPQDGTINSPYHLISQGVSAISAGGDLVLKGPRTTSEVPGTISKPMTIISVGGAATIGQ